MRGREFVRIRNSKGSQWNQPTYRWHLTRPDGRFILCDRDKIALDFTGRLQAVIVAEEYPAPMCTACVAADHSMRKRRDAYREHILPLH